MGGTLGDLDLLKPIFDSEKPLTIRNLEIWRCFSPVGLSELFVYYCKDEDRALESLEIHEDLDCFYCKFQLRLDSILDNRNFYLVSSHLDPWFISSYIEDIAIHYYKGKPENPMLVISVSSFPLPIDYNQLKSIIYQFIEKHKPFQANTQIYWLIHAKNIQIWSKYNDGRDVVRRVSICEPLISLGNRGRAFNSTQPFTDIIQFSVDQSIKKKFNDLKQSKYSVRKPFSPCKYSSKMSDVIGFELL
ncbi:MAG: hypothetical protein ACFFBD_12680 [Candidatus Hodarchaeota archaeon]